MPRRLPTLQIIVFFSLVHANFAAAVLRDAAAISCTTTAVEFVSAVRFRRCQPSSSKCRGMKTAMKGRFEAPRGFSIISGEGGSSVGFLAFTSSSSCILGYPMWRKRNEKETKKTYRVLVALFPSVRSSSSLLFPSSRVLSLSLSRSLTSLSNLAGTCQSFVSVFLSSLETHGRD